MHANHREEREEIGAGEIAATVGLKATTTGDTLAVETAPIRLESMTFPEPVICGRDRAEDEGRPGQARRRPAAPHRGGSDLPGAHRRGDGPDAHLRHGRAAPRDHRRPPDARVQRRRERRPAAGRLPRDDRQAGREDRGQVRPPDRRPRPVRPRRDRPEPAPGEGYEFVDKIVGGKIPREYIPSVDLGIQEAMESGVLAGYPVVDIRVELIEGSYHDVDSSEMAFKIAGSMAFKEAMKRAKPKLLEPVMAVEVVDARGVPRRRDGRPQLPPRARRGPRAARQRAGDQRARAALARCSATPPTCVDDAGPGHVHMQFDRYEEVPQSIASEIIDEPQEHGKNGGKEWPSRSSSARSRISTSARSVTSTTARRP